LNISGFTRQIKEITMSPQSMAPLSAAAGDPSQGATTGDPTSDQTGVVVCIAALPDGTFQIYQQSSQDDDQGSDASQSAPSGASGATPAGSGSPDNSGDEDNSQTADNIDDALAIAGQILEQASGASGAPDGSDDNKMLNPQDAKAAWNQMAAKKDKQRSQGM
jgi:hypothetical protein